MRRFFYLPLLVLAAVLVLFACTPAPSPSTSAPLPADGMTSDPTVAATAADIALITTEARFTSDFGQAVWTTITRYSGEVGVGSGSYKTEEDNPDACLATLELAVKAGAQMVVSMDESVSQAIATVQGQYPAVNFVLLDVKDTPTLLDNGVSVHFPAEQAGWLAGYYAAREAQGRLGIVALDTDHSQRYVLGFLLGAQASLYALEVEPEPLQVRLLTLDDAHYKKRRSYIDQMFTSGTRLMFTTAPELWQAALPTAQSMGYQLMGVGLPMAIAGDAALASVEENPKNLVYNLLDAWTNGNFPGGNAITGNVADGDITVVTEPYRFKRMPEWVQKKGLESFSSGMLALSINSRLRPDADGNLPQPQNLSLSLLQVQLVDPDNPEPDSSVSIAPASTPPVDTPPQNVTPPAPSTEPESTPPPDSSRPPVTSSTESAPSESVSSSEETPASSLAPETSSVPDSSTAPDSAPPPDSVSPPAAGEMVESSPP